MEPAGGGGIFFGVRRMVFGAYKNEWQGRNDIPARINRKMYLTNRAWSRTNLTIINARILFGPSGTVLIGGEYHSPYPLETITCNFRIDRQRIL